MIEVPKVIGAVVADIVRSSMTTPEEGRRPALRIAGFAHDEVVEILRALDEAAGAPATSPLVVKVGTASPIPGVNDKYILADGETLTGWRNAQVPALVLIDWDVQGDEEGLAALNRLDDVGVLSEQDPDLARQRFEKLIHHSWIVAGRGGPVPSRLLHDLEVVRSTVANSASLSLRTWTAYVATICVSLANEALVTPDVVDHAVGGHLSQLDLFPDIGLFQLDGSGRTRLVRNLRVSALRQPGGGPVTDEELLARIESTDLGIDLLRRFSISADEARTRMRAVALGGGPSAKATLDLSLWLELFERRPDRAGLGKLIREELAKSAPERLDEFEELEVEAGLDSSEQEAAERLLRNESSSGLRTLADVLPARLRRRLEKVAFPDAQVTNDPLRALLHVLSVLEDMPGEVVRLALEGSDDEGEWSRWLFCLLWGPTLLDVVDRSSESPRRLELDPRLIRVPMPEVADLEEDFEPARAWAPLRLVVDVSDGGRRRFRWNPLASTGLVAFGALLHSDGPAPGVPFAGDLDSLCERFTDPRGWSFLAAGAPHQLSSLPRELAELRKANLARMRLGLTADALDEYLEAWAALAERARDTLIPSNAPDPELAAVVLADIVELHEGRLAMLATHPLRLRWVARHLRRMTDLLVRSLATGLNLNRENTELFFEWLDRASPHGTPPFIVGADETVAIPVREVDWHEEYAPIRRNGVERRDWLAAVDDAAIDEMVGVLATYLDTYPYKQDGLVLLLLDREGTARLPLRIIQRLRARTPSVRVELHVLTPSSEHHEIVRAFEAAFADGEMGEEELFPDVQLMLRHWDPDSEPEIEDLLDRVDVALAPALFGTRTTLNRLTRDRHAGNLGPVRPVASRLNSRPIRAKPERRESHAPQPAGPHPRNVVNALRPPRRSLGRGSPAGIEHRLLRTAGPVRPSPAPVLGPPSSRSLGRHARYLHRPRSD